MKISRSVGDETKRKEAQETKIIKTMNEKVKEREIMSRNGGERKKKGVSKDVKSKDYERRKVNERGKNENKK